MKREEFKEKLEKTKPLSKKEEKELVDFCINNTDYHNFKGDTNLIIATEELAELQQCITKHLRGKGDKLNTTEEVADVLIGIEFIKTIMNLDEEEIKKAKAVKLNRIKERVKNEGSFK